MAERPGFGYALDKPQKQPAERQFDPVQRQYTYADRRAAAEDAAYVFFDLWQVPLYEWIKVEASTFEGPKQWERDFSMG